MTTKPSKTTTKENIESAASGKFDRKRATKGDRLVQLLRARSGVDIAALSGKLGWQPHSTVRRSHGSGRPDTPWRSCRRKRTAGRATGSPAPLQGARNDSGQGRPHRARDCRT
jgi:hypothetical protein